jgi:uncharacterized protein YggE
MLRMIVGKARVALCSMLAVLCFGAAARAEIAVTGTGKVVVVPDIASITLAVVTDGSTAAQALEENNAAMRRLFKLLGDLGIAERDVQTSHFGVTPRYHQVKDQPPVLVGYTVTNQVTIRVRKLGDTGKVLDSLVKAGANQVSSITFAVADPEKQLDQARALAMANARKKAEKYAAAAGAAVGKVLRISEQQFAPQMEWRYDLKAAASVPLAPGEQEVTVNVNVVYEIGGQWVTPPPRL